MTVLICRFRSNETLSELSENQLATCWMRKLPAVSYGYSDTADQPLVSTRDIAPVVQYIGRNSKYRNILDARIFQTGRVLRTAVIFFYLSNEGVSLLENAAHLDLPIPRVVKRALKQLHDKSEDDDKENKNEEQ